MNEVKVINNSKFIRLIYIFFRNVSPLMKFYSHIGKHTISSLSVQSAHGNLRLIKQSLYLSASVHTYGQAYVTRC